MYDLRIIDGLVYIGGDFIKTNIYIKDDKIAAITNSDLEANDTLRVSGSLVMPGLIDPHVHFHLDLGSTYSKDDFLSGSIQAAYGGITTIIDFLEPVDNPIDLEKAYYRRVEEASQSVVDYTFHACIKNPKCDLEEFVKKMLELNIHSLKLFTTYSDSDRRTYDDQIIELLKLSDKYKFIILAHIENDDLIVLDDDFTYKDLNRSRPSISETKEALKLASFVRNYGGYLYMVHLSSGYTIQKLVSEYKDILNKRFFIESCPHYFTFTQDMLNKDDGYLYTLAPPLRSKEEMIILRENIQNVYTIGTDHCAFFKEDKNRYNLKDIPLGIGGIEYSFDVMYKHFKNQVIDKMSNNISCIFRMSDRGSIEVGKKANLFVYSLMDNQVDDFHGFTDYSIYYGLDRLGRVIHTIKDGKFIVRNMQFQSQKGNKI